MMQSGADALAEVQSWGRWKAWRAHGQAERTLTYGIGTLTGGCGRLGRTVLLAAACGHAEKMGMPPVEGSYNRYAHQLVNVPRVTAEELYVLYRDGVSLAYSLQTLAPHRRAPWQTLLLLVRQQGQHKSLAPSMVMDVELPENEKRIARWIGHQISTSTGPELPEDVRVLVTLALELLEADEGAWEVLEFLTKEAGRLGRTEKPWTALLTRVQMAKELVRT